MTAKAGLRIAVVGSGISGLSAAWLMSRRHEVVLYEKARRLGGHTNTVPVRVDDRDLPVDTGFIVFNPKTYPNFVELLRALEVASQPSEMSFAASLDGGRLEYSGSSLNALFGQRSNLVNARFWSMLADLVRFYREAARDAKTLCDEQMSLRDYLDRGRYGAPFRDWHILPMASAIWSATPADILDYPAAAFLRFHHNHGLLQLTGRPIWRTVTGGAQAYVERLAQPLEVRLGADIARIERTGGHAIVVERDGARDVFDHVVLATHADEALALIDEPSAQERALLGAFRYSRNEAWLHRDESLAPRRRSVWSSWNYIGDKSASGAGCVTYWMNRLQALPTTTNLFVTLNPSKPPRAESVIRREIYHHPLFDANAIAAQRQLWSLQGARNTWFCGAHFGAGFHEDGLQAGLAVAEQLGGVRRPWRVEGESARIHMTAAPTAAELEAAA